MRPSRARPLARRAATVFVSVVLGGAALAAGARALHLQGLERQLADEVRAVRATGLIEREQAREPAELVAARDRLDAVLARVHEIHLTDEGAAFGAPWMQRAEWSDALTEGLRARAQLLAELDVAVEALHDAPREPACSPRKRPAGNLGRLRAATNLLCGRAWQVAREPHRGGEAGHWLAQALALLRVSDTGVGIELGVRLGMEQIVLDTLERLRAEAIVDRDALDDAILRELACAPPSDRLRLAVECELAIVTLGVEAGQALYEEPLDGAEARQRTLDYLRFGRSALARDLTGHHPPTSRPGADSSTPAHVRSLDIFAGWRDQREELLGRIRCDE